MTTWFSSDHLYERLLTHLRKQKVILSQSLHSEKPPMTPERKSCLGNCRSWPSLHHKSEEERLPSMWQMPSVITVGHLRICWKIESSVLNNKVLLWYQTNQTHLAGATSGNLHKQIPAGLVHLCQNISYCSILIVKGRILIKDIEYLIITSSHSQASQIGHMYSLWHGADNEWGKSLAQDCQTCQKKKDISSGTTGKKSTD